LNYQPNMLARGLATQKTHTLGLVIPDSEDLFYYQIMLGVQDALSTTEYTLLVASQARPATSHRYMQLWKQGRIDGMVLVGIDIRNDEVEQLLRREGPVAIVQQEVGPEVTTFTADNYGGARDLVTHLVGHHGYRRLAYITGSDYTPDNRARLRGLRDTLAEHGLELSPEYVVQGDYFRGSGYHAMQQLLQLPTLPDAIFAANDQMAGDALLALRERGLRVPEDIALVGFDNVPLASYVTPPLTTVHQPTYELGFAATRLVLQGIEQPSAPMHEILPTRLIIRRSCGCD
jgi:DNA-binding LacI/PurR family transcriptional regulator